MTCYNRRGRRDIAQTRWTAPPRACESPSGTGRWILSRKWWKTDGSSRTEWRRPVLYARRKAIARLHWPCKLRWERAQRANARSKDEDNLSLLSIAAQRPWDLQSARVTWWTATCVPLDSMTRRLTRPWERARVTPMTASRIVLSEVKSEERDSVTSQ